MGILSVLLVPFLSLSTPSVSTQTASYAYSNLIKAENVYPSQYINHFQSLQEELTFEKLQQLIIQNNIRDIPTLIAALPWQMRNDNYVVMYRSRSLQHASITQPRILSFTPTARLIISFNSGDKKVNGKTHEAHNSIEVVQFRDKQARFEFREIQFDDDRKKSPTFSAANPNKCLSCHQSERRSNIDPRPNWEPYNIWPGAIGAKDGGIIPGPIKPDSQRYQSYDRDFLAEQAREPEIIKQFLDIGASHARYQHLGSLNFNAPVALSELLAFLNFQRVIRLMKEEVQHYEKSKEAIAYLGECGQGFPSGDMFTFYKSRTPTDKFASYYPMSTSELITVLYEGAGIDTSDWSMDFGTKARFALYERFGTPTNTYKVFQRAWGTVNKIKRNQQQSDDFCRSLLDKAKLKWSTYQKELENKKPINEILRPERRSLSQIVSTCMNCHNKEDGVAPHIPFDQPDQFKSLLQRRPSISDETFKEEILYRTSEMATHGEQMPPQRRLSPEDRETLTNYIQSLSH